MRKLFSLLCVAFLTAGLAVAEAAPKKKPAEPEDLNANGKKAMRDALPLFMPSAVMFWMLHNKEVEAKQQADQAKVAKVKAGTGRRHRKAPVAH
jgi:hypothetical protein